MAELTRRALLAVPAGLALAAALPVPAAEAHSDPWGLMLGREHAAIYLYGVLTPRLPPTLRPAAQAAYDDHRRHRDELEAAIRAQRGVPAAALPAYEPIVPVDSPGGPLRLATAIEEGLLATYYEAVAEVPKQYRAMVAKALVEEARRVALWRYAEKGDAATAASPFPGRG